MVEKGIGTALFFLPDRFGDQEFQTVLLNSVFNLAKLYHDSVWVKFAHYVQGKKKLDHVDETETPRDNHEYVSKQVHQAAANTSYFPKENVELATLLSALENVSLLAELATEMLQKTETIHRNTNLKDIVIFGIELLKAILRFRLLLVNNGGILSYRNIPPRPGIPSAPVKDRNADEDDASDTDEEEAETSQHEPEYYEDGRRKRPTLLSVLAAQKRKKEKSQNGKRDTAEDPGMEALNGLQQMFTDGASDFSASTSSPFTSIPAEILWILRPLVYLMLVHRSSKNSWWPLLVAVCMDGLSWRLHKRNMANASKAESDELSKRLRFSLFFYLFRSPLSDIIFGPLEPSGDTPASSRWGGWNALGKLPLVNSLASTFSEFLNLYRKRYFYTAAST